MHRTGYSGIQFYSSPPASCYSPRRFVLETLDRQEDSSAMLLEQFNQIEANMQPRNTSDGLDRVLEFPYRVLPHVQM